MADERNFRSVYYGKVGFKGIEEKKSLEIILKEEPIDKGKLSQFCIKFPVPIAYRYYIWQILLGVLPCYQNTHPLASEQRKHQFEDLKRALEVMRKIDQTTSTEVVFLKMYLIEEKSLPFDDVGLVDNNQYFLFIAKIMIELVSDEVLSFWMCVKFMNLLEKQTKNVEQFIGEIESIINREAIELFQHMCKYNLFDTVPFHLWISSAFSSLFHSECLEKIWDRIIGGGPVYLSYISAAIVVAMKRQIMALRVPLQVAQLVNQISNDHVELILSLAQDLWHKDGCPLEPQVGDLPVIIEKAAGNDTGIIVARGYLEQSL